MEDGKQPQEEVTTTTTEPEKPETKPEEEEKKEEETKPEEEKKKPEEEKKPEEGKEEEKEEPAKWNYEGRNPRLVKADVSMISGCMDMQYSADMDNSDETFKLADPAGLRCEYSLWNCLLYTYCL